MSQEHADFEVNIDMSSDDVAIYNGEGSAPKLPIGDFVFQITSAEQRNSSGGNPCLLVTSVVAEGEHTGVTMERWFSFSKAALPFLKALAIAIGADLTAVRSSEYIGKYYMGSVKHETQKDWINAQGETKAGGIKAEIYNIRAAEEAAPEAEAAPKAAAPKAAAKTAAAPTAAARAAVGKAMPATAARR